MFPLKFLPAIKSVLFPQQNDSNECGGKMSESIRQRKL